MLSLWFYLKWICNRSFTNSLCQPDTGICEQTNVERSYVYLLWCPLALLLALLLKGCKAKIIQYYYVRIYWFLTVVIPNFRHHVWFPVQGGWLCRLNAILVIWLRSLKDPNFLGKFCFKGKFQWALKGFKRTGINNFFENFGVFGKFKPECWDI